MPERCIRARSASLSSGRHAAGGLPHAPGDRGRDQTARAAVLGEGVEEGVGGGVVGLAGAAEGWPRPRRRGRRRRGRHRRSARAGARRPRPWGRRRARAARRSSTRPCRRRARRRCGPPPPAAAPRGSSRAAPPAASRSETSQAAIVTSAPSPSSSARSSPAPAASAPLRLARSRWRAPCSATRWRATRAPRPPLPPVISTVFPGSIGAAMLSTTLPTFLPSRRWRKASGASRTSQLAIGGVLKGAGLEVGENLSEHLSEALGTGLAEVKGLVGDPGPLALYLLRIADVDLAHLEEAAAAGQQLQRGVDELRRQRVEDDVDTLAAGDLEEPVPEVEVARGGDVVLGDPRLAQRLPLGRAGGGEDLGAGLLGELDRGHADAAGAGVDQHPLPRPQTGKVVQAVVGGEENSGTAAACSKLQPRSGIGAS